MEPSSTLHSVPSFKNLRAGQKEVVDLFLTKDTVTAQLPTGYGKTRAAAASYALLRGMGRVNRALIIVPRGAQADQIAEEFPRIILEMGVPKTQSHIVGDNTLTAIKANRRGTSEVFVITVQSLVSSRDTLQAVSDLMGNGRWLVVIDEHHHYGNSDDNVWTQRVTGLPHAALLAMSATPNRNDGPSVFGTPDIVVSYLDALEEKTVKDLSLHAYEYRVDAITINGDVIPFDTRELFKAVGSDNPQEVDKWMASRQMRWSPKYISPLVLYPVERIASLRVKGVRAQMLIQAISCSHAKMVCDQVRAIIPEGMTIEWVGTGMNGRSDSDNKSALNRFCPPKDADGRRRWELDVLVNVGIAGEGLDTMDVCEIVFLTSPNINNSSLQTIGRGSRVMPWLSKQPTCIINVDGASELAKYVGPKIMGVFDGIFPEEKDNNNTNETREPNEYEPLPDKLMVGILDVTLLDIRKDPMFQDALDHTLKTASHLGSPEQIARIVEDRFREYVRERDERFNANAVEAQTRDRVTMSVRKVAGLVVRKAVDKFDFRPQTTLIGDICKRINAEKRKRLGGIEAASVPELERHYQWIKQLEAQILNNQVPSWLR